MAEMTYIGGVSVKEAARRFTADPCTLLDIAPRLTCGEAEAFATLLAALDYPWLAVQVLVAHADGDDDEDDAHRSPAMVAEACERIGIVSVHPEDLADVEDREG